MKQQGTSLFWLALERPGSGRFILQDQYMLVHAGQESSGL